MEQMREKPEGKINKSIEKDIAKAKKKLIRTAIERNELWENFGNIEMGKLEDKYRDYFYNIEVDTDQIDDFQKWCWNFDLDVLSEEKNE